MKYLAFILSTLLSLEAIASTCETNYRIVDECYETRGRLQAANGNPSVRIWKVGTKRVLGVRNENLENLPTKVKEEFSFGVFVFADYKVCPLTKEKPGHMQMVCVESMKNIRIEDYRENPDVPVVTRIQNETEQGHAVGQSARYARTLPLMRGVMQTFDNCYIAQVLPPSKKYRYCKLSEIFHPSIQIEVRL